MTTGTLDDYRQTLYRIAEAIAPTWERRRADIEQMAAPVREWMLRELRLRSGDTVLELAAGAGDTGFEAAGIVGATGRLITTDLSPTMVDVARRRGAELGVANVEYRVMDAEQLTLDDDAVDAVVCRFSYMLMADPAAALAETRRVLRPGGRLALAVWDAPERNPFLTLVAGSLVQHGHVDPPEPPPAPGPFSMASAQRVQALAHGAGFATVRTEEVAGRAVFPSVDAYLNVIADTAGPFGLTLQSLSGPDRAAVRADVEDGLQRFAAAGGYELPCVALCAVAE
ncbi:MAG TPA: methyltransferase domain-containing protein [Solirubrobacteraceae bacterium]|nr:methyltransferase domain-containing protein [Solirubrobacteraceae bacterium]